MRNSIRFAPDPLDVALLQFDTKQNIFTPEEVALIINESYTGTALIIYTQRKILPETTIVVKVGKLAQMRARIVWVKELEKTLIKMGIQFLE